MIDLHVHTNNSDGLFSVSDILVMAEKKNINTISFCDHNTLKVYEELEKINVKELYSGKIIPGIEFDFVYNGNIFHMLGYNFDIEKLNKSKFIDTSTAKDIVRCETERLEFLSGVCKKLGIKISDNLYIDSPNIKANDLIKADMNKYEENKEILDELLGKNREIPFFRGHITNPKSPFFIDFTKGTGSAEEIAGDIHNAGGIVVLPHVFEYKFVDNVQFLNEIYDKGIIDGIECIHTKHNKEKIDFLKDFAQKRDLIITGGSDFHNEENYSLGYGDKGNIPITDDYKFRK